MNIEYNPTTIGVKTIPDLCIQISELLKTKDFYKDASAGEERYMFLQALQIYTYYCGQPLTITTTPYKDFLDQVGKRGKLIISCVKEGPSPDFLVRVISDEGEKKIDCHFTSCI